jgi:DNA topoisomerase-2
MTPTTLVIENSGTPIPVEYKEENKMYVPELIFGVPGSSSHYTEDVRHEAGVNGLGVKLTNVFSKYFHLYIVDPINKKSYEQVWHDMGLEGREEPVIKDTDKINAVVRVTFHLDFKHFGYESAQASAEMFALFARHCADISFTAKVPVEFAYSIVDGAEENTILTFDIPGPKDYAFLYFGETVENSLTHYEWPKGTRLNHHQEGRQSAKDPTVVPLVEMCMIDTPDNSENISFVNSMMTRDGGIHVEAALKSISGHIVKYINGNETAEGMAITLKHVRPNISLVLSVRVENPGFSGQTKNKLSDPNPFVPRIKITDKEVKCVRKWTMIQHLLAIIEAKKTQLLSKTDGKKKGNISGKNIHDANKAGKKDSAKCTLYIVEGLSASGYTLKFRDNMENGPDYCGILPIRGKFLNVMRAKYEKIANNREVKVLKKMLGLKEGVDYSDPENFKELRYGRVVIMADADDDGKHIVALLLLYFHCFFPSLLKIHYVYNYLSPIIRVLKGKRKEKFYTFSEYKEWFNKTRNAKTWKTIYFKGLGRAEDDQIKEDYENQRVIKCVYDDYAPQTIRLAFSKDKNHERKAWLAHFSLHIDDAIVEEQPISDFINTELIKYGMVGLRRAIPYMCDGFKDSQRKAMWGAFQIWNNGKMGNIHIGNAKFQKMKVARFAAKAAEETNYHHGERSLEGTIVGMAQDFTGANNLPYFFRAGQFGSRMSGGKDAADPRYIETMPEWWIPYVFRQEDVPILTLKEDEGEVIEPECFYPIIPMALINGCNGIALAYSTFIPNHNPLDILKWLKAKMHDEEPPELKPWYRGFQGTIEIVDRRAKKRKFKGKGKLDIPDPKHSPVLPKKSIKKEPAHLEGEESGSNHSSDDEEETQPSNPDFLTTEKPDYMEELEEYARNYREEKGRPLYSFVSKGDFYTSRNGKIMITELPIGRWTEPYQLWLEQLRQQKKLRDVRNVSKSNLPGFEITGFTDIPSYKSLNLQSQIGMSNMVLLARDGKPKRFDTIHDILEEFYVIRLEMYNKRKAYLLKEWKAKIPQYYQKRLFIQSVVEEKLVINKRKKEDVYADMDALHLDHKLLSETNASKFTQDEIDKLEQYILDLETDIETLTKTDAKVLWEAELCEFEAAYRKHYKLPKRGQKLSVKVSFKHNTTAE